MGGDGEQQIKVQEAEASRRKMELEATVVRAADAERQRVQTLAEAERQRIALEAEGRAAALRAQAAAEARQIQTAACSALGAEAARPCAWSSSSTGAALTLRALLFSRECRSPARRRDLRRADSHPWQHFGNVHIVRCVQRS